MHQCAVCIRCPWIRVELLLDWTNCAVSIACCYLTLNSVSFQMRKKVVMKMHGPLSPAWFFFLVEELPWLLCIYFHSEWKGMMDICTEVNSYYTTVKQLSTIYGWLIPCPSYWREFCLAGSLISPTCDYLNVFDALQATRINEVTRVGAESLVRQITSRWRSRTRNLGFAINKQSRKKKILPEWIPACCGSHMTCK